MDNESRTQMPMSNGVLRDELSTEWESLGHHEMAGGTADLKLAYNKQQPTVGRQGQAFPTHSSKIRHRAPQTPTNKGTWQR